MPQHSTRPCRLREIHTAMQARMIGLPQINALILYGVDGHMVNTTRSWPVPPVNIRDADYFQAIIGDAAANLSFTAPFQYQNGRQMDRVPDTQVSWCGRQCRRPVGRRGRTELFRGFLSFGLGRQRWHDLAAARRRRATCTLSAGAHDRAKFHDRATNSWRCQCRNDPRAQSIRSNDAGEGGAAVDDLSVDHAGDVGSGRRAWRLAADGLGPRAWHRRDAALRS